MSAAVMACLYEGWALSESEAEMLIRRGKVQLHSAQECNASMPLAAVASPSANLVGITDKKSHCQSWSLLDTGAESLINYGIREYGIIEKMIWRDTVLAPTLKKVIQAHPIDLVSIARQGLIAGDDLHASTSHAQNALASTLSPFLKSLSAHSSVLTMLNASPLFFQTLWMAACDAMLSAATAKGKDAKSVLIVAIASNGKELGVRVAGQPNRWFTSAAPLPAGPLNSAGFDANISPAIGDSGVIEAAGFGLNACHLAPDLAFKLNDWLPIGWRSQTSRLMLAENPLMPGLKIRMGMDATSNACLMSLAGMLASDGKTGYLGQGVIKIGTEVFEQIIESVKQSNNFDYRLATAE